MEDKNYGKKKEVVRCVRQQTIATYDVNDGFLVDVVCGVKEQVYAYWLYHKDCGVKVLYVQVPITNISNPKDVVNNIDPKFWDEDKQHYSDNYILV